MKYDVMVRCHWDMARDAARDWFPRAVQNPCRRFYLYFQPAKMRLFMDDEPHAGWENSGVGSMPVNLTEDQATTWIYNETRRVPLFTPEAIAILELQGLN